MAGALSMLELQKRFNRLESQQAILNKTVKDLGSRFAWYWYNDRVKVFAVITAIKGSVASLVGFSEGLAGGIIQEPDVEMFVNNPLLEDDEQKREGKWEPILDVSLLLDQLVENAKKAAEKVEEAKSIEASEDPVNDDSTSDTEATAAA